MKRLLCKAILAIGTIALAGGATAQQWPAHPIRLIVPFPPGGGTDQVGRLLADRLSASLGQPVIVDNRAGAGGMIGSQLAAHAAPDGYTLLVGISGTHVSPVAMKQKMPYDAVRDFTPITRIGVTPNLLLVHPDFPAKDLKEFVALLKSKPGAYSYGSWGNGSGGHFAGEFFKSLTSIDMTHLPYKGAAAVLSDVMGGHIQIAFGDGASAPPQVRAGKVRALGSAGPFRAPGLPEVPAFAEQGIPFDLASWYGVFGPKDMPAEIVAKLSGALRAIIDAPEMRERFAAAGIVPASTSPEEFARIIGEDIATWTKVADEADIQAAQ